MAEKHAFLSASSAHRWIACPPSAKINAELPDTTSEYAQQGTDAHSLCEYKVRKFLNEDVKDPTEDLTFFDNEMSDCSEMYLQYVTEQVAEAKEHCKDPLVLVEQRLDFSEYVPQGFGTGDCVIVSDEVLQIIDLKYGVGVLVEAEDNPQMKCYALGALGLFDGLYDIQKIKMTIFQPRREHISTSEISKKELLEWAEDVLKPIAELAIKGDGEFKAGDHCKFCKVKATCRKRAEYNLELAKYDFQMPDTLQDDEVEIILSKAAALTAWIKDIEEYALKQAVNGKKWNDWKLIEGKSNRKYTNENDVAAKVVEAGYDPYEKKVMGITAMTKMLGKTKFEELLGKCITKSKGKPSLVPKNDKRKELNNIDEDFKEEN